jgi:heat shock protein HslJ
MKRFADTKDPKLGSAFQGLEVFVNVTEIYAKDFEGEADPSKMSLGMKKWEWIKTQMNDGKIITPKKYGEFTLVFSKDGTLSVETDCNHMSGTYTVNKNMLSFNKLISTMMYCEGSQEQEFAKTLNEVVSYLFTSKGELVLEIKMDSGTMIFR